MWSNIQSTVEYTLFSTSLKTMTKSQKKKKISVNVKGLKSYSSYYLITMELVRYK